MRATPFARQAHRVVYLVAGEPSADAIGAHLIHALSRDAVRRRSTLRLVGVAGPKMIKASRAVSAPMRSLFPYQQLTVMGIAEVAMQLPTLWRCAKAVATDVERVSPHAVVFLDGKGFARNVAERLRRNQAGLNYPLIQYVAPSIWAWKDSSRSIKTTERLFDHLFLLFPFEMDHWARSRIPTSLIGSPAVENYMTSKGTRQSQGSHQSITLLLGSRPNEIRQHAEIIGHSLKLLRPDIRSIVPVVSEVAPLVQREVSKWHCNDVKIHQNMMPADWSSSTVGCVASGTAALEAALWGLPIVVFYKCNWLTAFIARRRAKVRFVSIPNIIADREIIQEHLFERCKPANVYQSVALLLANKDEREAQLEMFTPIRENLILHCHGRLPSERAVTALNDILGDKSLGNKRSNE